MNLPLASLVIIFSEGGGIWRDLKCRSLCRLAELLETEQDRGGGGGGRGISQLVVVSEEWNRHLDQFVRIHVTSASHPQVIFYSVATSFHLPSSSHPQVILYSR